MPLAPPLLQHKRDVGRFVRWPRYVKVQRQRKILWTRLKVPPSLNQFKGALDRNQAAEVFKLLTKYSPETKAEKRERIANAAAAGNKTGEAPAVLKFGLNHVTQLIESKKAQLVVIANDVDPIEVRARPVATANGCRRTRTCVVFLHALPLLTLLSALPSCSWSCGCPPCAARWTSRTSSSRTVAAWVRWCTRSAPPWLP